MPVVRFGVIILPDQRWQQAARRWRLAEDYGFDHAWTYDHLGWRTLVDGPWFDAVPTLTAAATVSRGGENSSSSPITSSPNRRCASARARPTLRPAAGASISTRLASSGRDASLSNSAATPAWIRFVGDPAAAQARSTRPSKSSTPAA